MRGTASQRSTRANRISWLVVGVIMLVFGGAIVLVTLHIRNVLGTYITQQDGIALYAASMVPSSLMEDLPSDLADDPEILFDLIANKVLEASMRQEVIGVRVFDSNGAVKTGIGLSVNSLGSAELAELRERKLINRFEPAANLRVAVGHTNDTIAPLIRALVPLEQDGQFIGAAEFILDGYKVAMELKRLDRDLWMYSGLIFFISGGITVGALFWAFGRLRSANKLLAERTRNLLHANHELTLAAKTSAVGAITAHLIHDLKSPLFGLQSFVSTRGAADDEDWEIALDTTQRMQKVIAEIVRILQEERTTEKYELSIEEVVSLLRGKLEPQCHDAGLRFKADSAASGLMMNRDANVILLVVTNIVQNALQATPRGGEIALNVSTRDGNVIFEISDTGPGLPDEVVSTLFTPSRSTKSGGTGLGLAISKQLANHIGAELSLKQTSRSGTVFELRVPDRLLISDLVPG